MRVMGYRRGRADIRMKRFPGDTVGFDAEDHEQEFKHRLREKPKKRNGRFSMKMSRFVRRFTRINRS
jgi:hypothetical protein